LVRNSRDLVVWAILTGVVLLGGISLAWVLAVGRLDDEQRGIAAGYGQFVVAVAMLFFGAVGVAAKSLKSRNVSTPSQPPARPDKNAAVTQTREPPVPDAEPHVERVSIPDRDEDSVPELFSQRPFYDRMQFWLLAAILAAAAVPLLLYTKSPEYSESVMSIAFFAVGVPAVALGMLTMARFPSTYELIINAHQVSLKLDPTKARLQHHFLWHDISKVRIFHNPENGRYFLELLLMENRYRPEFVRLRHGPRPASETNWVMFADVSRLDARPEHVENALAKFAGDKLVPCEEIAEQSLPSTVRFATRYARILPLTVLLAVAGLSPLQLLLTADLTWWRLLLLVLWTVPMCAPAVLAVYLVHRPASLAIDDRGLSYQRKGHHEWRCEWDELTAVTILAAHRSGIGPRFVFLRTTTNKGLPETPGVLRRLSARLNGTVLCDLFTLSADHAAVEEALARFGKSKWQRRFHPDHGLDRATATVTGRSACLSTLISCVVALVASTTLFSFAAGGDSTQGGLYVLASLTAILAYVAAAGLCTLRPCRLTIDSDGLTISLTRTRGISPIRRALRLPEPARAVVLWENIDIVQMRHKEWVGRRKRKPVVVTASDIRLAITRRQSRRSWRLSPLFGKADGMDVLCPVDGTWFYLNASAGTVDALLREFAGDRYREPRFD
jgi:hypothetical protein